MDINTKAARICRRIDLLDMWIPVTEDLPENALPVLVTATWDNQNYVTVAFYSSKDGEWLKEEDCAVYPLDVIAWQELPIPYKKG